MALILQQKEKKDPLDILMQGLTIASQVYGIKANRAALDEHELKMKATQENKPYEDSVKQSNLDQMAFEKRQRDKIETTPAERPRFPTRMVDTVDAQGAPVQRIVEDRPGQSFIKPPEKSAAGHKVTSQTAQEVGSFEAAFKMADLIEADYNKLASQPGASFRSYIPGADANLYDQTRDYAAQNIGLILEKGKLTDKDYDRYKGMMPRPTDTNAQAAQKLKALRQFITAKREGDISGLQQAGFDTSNFKDSPKANDKPAAADTSGQAQAGESDPLMRALEIKAMAGDEEAKLFLRNLRKGK